MFLLDLKGTRERSPGSQRRGGPAQGPENDRGKRRNVLWRRSAPLPSLRPQDLGISGQEDSG